MPSSKMNSCVNFHNICVTIDMYLCHYQLKNLIAIYSDHWILCHCEMHLGKKLGSSQENAGFVHQISTKIQKRHLQSLSLGAFLYFSRNLSCKLLVSGVWRLVPGPASMDSVLRPVQENFEPRRHSGHSSRVGYQGTFQKNDLQFA